MKREVKIGLFAVAMLVCLYFGINYLKGKDFFSSDRTFYAMFDHTLGLQTSAPVVLRGVKVGSVTAIEIDPEASESVKVTMGIKRGISVPVDSRFKLFSDGLMGGKSIELVRGTAEGFFESGAVVPSENERGLLESTSSGIGDMVAQARELMVSLEATSNTLNGVLERSADSFAGIMTNVESVTGQISDARVGQMLGDIRAFTTMLRDNSERMESIVGNLDAVSSQMAEADLRGTIEGLGITVERLNSVLLAVESGEGTAGRLVRDPALYDSLTVATGRLSALLEDLKANPKRYVRFSVF